MTGMILLQAAMNATGILCVSLAKEAMMADNAVRVAMHFLAATAAFSASIIWREAMSRRS